MSPTVLIGIRGDSATGESAAVVSGVDAPLRVSVRDLRRPRRVAAVSYTHARPRLTHRVHGSVPEHWQQEPLSQWPRIEGMK